MDKKIHIFSYKGLSFFDDKIKGTINALDINDARQLLNNNGIKILSLKKNKGLFSSKATKKITQADIISLCRQLATLINAGINMSRALHIIQIGHIKVDFQNMIYDINNSVIAGNTLYLSIREWPKYFDDYFCETVNMAEHTGNLGRMLNSLADTLEKSQALKRKVKKSLAYPVTILVVVTIVVTLMLTFLVPQFEKSYANFGAELPGATQALISISKIFSNYWYLVLAGIIGAVLAFRFSYEKNKIFHFFIDKFVTKIPFFGVLVRKSIAARVVSALSTSIAGGFPAADAIYKVGPLANNLYYQYYLEKIADQVTAGQNISHSFQITTIFPDIVPNMVAIGEESGRLPEMLGKAGDYLEEEVNLAASILEAIMEPMIIVVVALVIIGIIVPLYLPIFNLGSVI